MRSTGYSARTGRRLFMPRDVPGLAQLFDASLGITITGSGVSTWRDQVGAHDATQATDGQRPTVAASAINGQAAVAFAGTQVLTHGLVLGKPATVFAVAKSTGDTSNYRGVYGTRAVFLFAVASGTANWGLFQGANVLSGQSLAAFKVVAAVVRDYNDVDLRTNGASVTVATGVAAYDPLDGLVGAGSAAGQQNLSGQVAFVAAYNRVLTVPECQRVEAYLKNRYAL